MENSNENSKKGKRFGFVKKAESNNLASCLSKKDTSKAPKPLMPESSAHLSMVSSDTEISSSSFIDIFNGGYDIKTTCHMLDGLKTRELPSRGELSDLVTEIMNSIHAIFINGSKLGVTWETVDDFGEPKTEFTSESAMVSYYSNRKMPYKVVNDEGETKRKHLDIYTAWKENRASKRFNGVTFDPSREGNDHGYFNLWQGFKLVPDFSGVEKCESMLDHIKHIYCGGNESYYTYFVQWLAHMVQKPEEKPEVAVILRSSEKGSGKSTLISSFIRPLLKNNQMSTASESHVTGRFNGHLADKLVLTLEEATFAGDKGSNNVIKDLITSEVITIEKKHAEPIGIRSYLRVINITNSDWSVPASKDERRYFVLDVDGSKAQSVSYFSKLYSDMENGGREQLFGFLKQLDISDFDKRNAPKTGALKAQIALSLSNEEKYALQLINEYEIFDYTLDEGIPGYVIHEHYCDFVKDTCYGKPLPQIQFTKAMVKCLGISMQTQQMVYVKDGSGRATTTRKKGNKFSSRDACRDELIKNLNISKDSFE